jgi:hypothetical protein
MSPEVPNNLGGLAIFSFVSAESSLQVSLSFPELQQRLREAVANSALLRGGMLLDSRERGGEQLFYFAISFAHAHVIKISALPYGPLH